MANFSPSGESKFLPGTYCLLSLLMQQNISMVTTLTAIGSHLLLLFCIYTGTVVYGWNPLGILFFNQTFNPLTLIELFTITTNR